MNAVAVVLAKGKSSRVPEKNIREFHKGRSLLEIKIDQCLKSGVFDSIYVSSDSEKVKTVTEHSGACFLERAACLCDDNTPFADVLTGILASVPVSQDCYIGWILPTSPLFHRYSDAVELMVHDENRDSVMTVTRKQHYFLNADYLPLNFQYGVWYSYSQNIRPIYQMTCAFWYAKKKDMLANRFPLGSRPAYLETSTIESVDIDTMEEFETAQILYGKKYGSR
jgi:CMP-N-acetylneuraminic acid synthetase